VTARSDIAYLVGSDNRVTILETLRERPRGPSELASVCSCARETAHRCLAGFVDRGWVERENGRYRITTGGEMVVRRYGELESTMVQTNRLEPFLRRASPSFRGLPADLLPELHLETATSEDPHAPVSRFRSVLGEETLNGFRGVTPVVSAVFNEAAARVIAPETDAELVIDESVLRASKTAYEDALDEAFALSGFTLLLAPEPLTFGLVLADGHAYTSVYDDGSLVASVDSDDEAFVRWVTGLYEETRRGARVVEPDTDPTAPEMDEG
jgi:predicted transcriptional regulator